MIVNHSCAKMHLLLQCSSIKSLLERTAVAVDKYNSTNFVFFSERTLLVGSLLGKSSFPSPTTYLLSFPNHLPIRIMLSNSWLNLPPRDNWGSRWHPWKLHKYRVLTESARHKSEDKHVDNEGEKKREQASQLVEHSAVKWGISHLHMCRPKQNCSKNTLVYIIKMPQ